MEERLEELEEHVTGLSKEDPGLLMRVDRLEWFVKCLVVLAGLGFGTQVLEVLGALVRQAVGP